MIDSALSNLHPTFQPLAQKVLDTYRATGRKVEVAETWRDPKREDELHAKGITPATGATCKHCFTIDGKPASKAFDFRLYDEDGNYITDGTDDWYAEFGDMATAEGLLWGGNFVHAPKDYDHVEIPDALITTNS